MIRAKGGVMLRRVLLGLVVMFAAVYYTPQAHAFTVSPGVIEVSLEPGERSSGRYTVNNPTDKHITIKMSVEDWSSGQYDREVDKGEKDSLGWLALKPNEIKLEPHGSKIVNYEAILPDGAQGEYSAMIYFSAPPEASNGGVAIATRIGNGFYAIAKGTEEINGVIDDIVILNTAPFRMDVTISNEGNVHVRPRGEVVIWRKGLFLSDSEKAPVKIPFNKPGFPVRPTQNYIYEVRAKNQFEPGKYELELRINYGAEVLKKRMKFKAH